MALTQFVFGQLGTDIAVGTGPALASGSADSEGIAPTTSNQTTTKTAPRVRSGGRALVRVSTDTAVYVSFGTAPNATSDAGRIFMPANAIDYFYLDSAFKAAVVTA